MSHAALLSGLALANSGLGMAHGVAAALGVHAQIPHGLACAVMLPQALKINPYVSISALADAGRAMQRGLLSSSLTDQSTRETAESVPLNSDDAAADFSIQLIDHLCQRIRIPRTLSEVGVASGQIPAIVASSRDNSMSGNPRDIPDGELTALLEAMTV